MTKKYVLSAFKRAGFPLKQVYDHEYQYNSSCIRVRYQPGNGAMSLPLIRVYAFRGNLAEFDSPTKALRLIRGRMAMEYVPGNEWALNTGRRGTLKLVAA